MSWIATLYSRVSLTRDLAREVEVNECQPRPVRAERATISAVRPRGASVT